MTKVARFNGGRGPVLVRVEEVVAVVGDDTNSPRLVLASGHEITVREPVRVIERRLGWS